MGLFVFDYIIRICGFLVFLAKPDGMKKALLLIFNRWQYLKFVYLTVFLPLGYLQFAQAQTSKPQVSENQRINKLFLQKKGFLPFPVKKGNIVSHFGKREQAGVKGVVFENSGIEIRTNPGEAVYIIYDGIVSSIATVPSMGGQVVMIKHGDYYSVYARVKNPLIKIGQKVKAKQMLGIVYMDKKGVSQLQFQIWRGTQKLNPLDWLIKR